MFDLEVLKSLLPYFTGVLKEKPGKMIHEELPNEHQEPLIGFLHRVIRIAVKLLAVLMVIVILWGVVDIVYVIYRHLTTPPLMLLSINDIFQTFGAFMVVLIAIEIFVNIRLYLGTHILPIQLVVATALMAIARKVIILDLKNISADYLIGIAAVIFALGVSYWLVAKK